MILINLLPQEFQKKETVRFVIPEVPSKKTLIGIAVAVLVLQVVLSAAAAFFMWREKIVNREILAMNQEVHETHGIRSKTLQAVSKLKDIKVLTEKKFYWASLMNAISGSVTKGVWLRALSLDEITEEPPKSPPTTGARSVKKKEPVAVKVRVLKLEGSVVAAGQETAFIGRFAKSLKDNPYFEEIFSDIQLSNIIQRKIKDNDVYDFVLFCEFKKGKI